MLAVTSDVKFYATGPRSLSCHNESGKHNLFCLFHFAKANYETCFQSKGEILRNANVLEHYTFRCFKI